MWKGGGHGQLIPHRQQKLGQRQSWDRALQSPQKEEGRQGRRECIVWFLFCDREQRRNWHLGELFRLSSICNKSSSISSPQTLHRLPR